MADLLFEIGCEEIPARFIAPAMENLAALAKAEFEALGIAIGAIKTYATPRRLALMASQVAEIQADRVEVALGPPMAAAFDANGNPSKAAEGFAKSLGVDVCGLEKIDTEKGVRLGLSKQVPGQPTLRVLQTMLPKLALSIPWPKSMRWGSHKIRFARPLHWFVALLGEQVVEFEVAGVKSGRLSYGHRFMAPSAIAIAKPADYVESLRKAHVMANRDERKAATLAEVQAAAQAAGGRLLPDEVLLNEVADLVELPVAGHASFDKEFLEVPKAVIISAMRSHQRYFALEDAAGKLLPSFVMVNNTRPKDLSLVCKGHERVLRARLADAAFFVREDTKRPLMERLEDLKQVTYHAKLGTSYDKVERFAKLALHLGAELKLGVVELNKLKRAAQLAKCDLVTGLVGEFPDLQGQVGEEYARRGGEEAEVALAVREHYMPTSAGGEMPSSLLGMLVGIADRLDTICGCFSVGLIPTGAADPYGLRRAAIAIIRIISERALPISLGQALDYALNNLAPWSKQDAALVKAKVLEFFAARLSGVLAEEGVGGDVAEAVVAAGMDDLTALKAKALALATMKKSEDFKVLASGLKRVFNLLRKESGQLSTQPVNHALLKDTAEKELHQQFKMLQEEAKNSFAKGQYLEFLQGLSALKQPIDNFFNDVMVMTDDKALRENRLALLQEIGALFGRLAQFNHLQL